MSPRPRAEPPEKRPGKTYDERYFRRWYGSRGSVASDADLARRARLAVAAAEYLLERRARSVLDVGCGEGRWRGALRRVRPGLVYVGVDPSEYVVRRHGRRRGIRLGAFGALGSLPPAAHVRSDRLRGRPPLRGLGRARARARGDAQAGRRFVYAPAFTAADDFVGDREGWHARSPRAYRRAFGAAGFVPCGLACWVPAPLADRVSALERCD